MNYSNMIEEKNLKKTFIVATLISTIIGTFTTGINLFDRVGEKRKQNKKDSGQDAKLKELELKFDEAVKKRDHHARREEELRNSLESGGPVVRSEYNRDLARLGPRFAEGDPITQTQLQSQVITMQGTVINLLQEALYTGKLDNLNKLYNASEFARRGTLDALDGQYQRMLQAAPISRPPGMVRRISSTPSVKTERPRTIKGRPDRERTVKGTVRGTEVNAVKAAPPATSHSRSDVKETAALTALDGSGALFCPYSLDLQETNMPLDVCFSKGGSLACPMCGTRVSVESGKAWKIDKEIVHEKISTPEYDDEVVEERTFLLNNRFIVKCHREQAGFGCVLCYRHRDRDTICESIGGLVKHIWTKHDISEYESDPDLKEVSKLEERTTKKF